MPPIRPAGATQSWSSRAGFSAILPHAIELTPLATEFRYLGDAFEPSTEEAANALTLAAELTAWTASEFSKLPLPKPPNNQ